MRCSECNLACNSIPIDEEVKGACEILGLDPLYVASEGKLLAIAVPQEVDSTLKALRAHPLGKKPLSSAKSSTNIPDSS
jgi:hydrogenase maturation factor